WQDLRLLAPYEGLRFRHGRKGPLAGSRENRVVPISVNAGNAEADCGQLTGGHLGPERIVVGVEPGFDLEAGHRRRGGNEVDDDAVGRQGLSAPVLADEGEEPMLDLVPLAGAGREVADRDWQPDLVGELL